ncbi:NAD-dependent epimerase/dehydratase family protein [Rathayibacter sp. VKM Ac-2759]|uniref:GDP-L-fucose synthase family protein n=1 Tax=Rathayibacter sp. VKM Ac-2759 TaxID=2609252 RepID=UPI001318EFAE|nr:GDP-L-fucose synthase [Rathayibacter sp. VKM Ac-2759]QHC65687.1 NAD-dependent epimerase/dehydratase family protein [Rathayibacter sp. VKM Ac-2759]
MERRGPPHTIGRALLLGGSSGGRQRGRGAAARTRGTILSNERVLVTGSTGVIGTAIVHELREHGYDVFAASSEQADLRDESATAALLNTVAPDSVIHLAARVHGLMGNLRSPGEMYFDNARINTNVVEASRLAGVRKIVAMGSVAMYSDGLRMPMRESDIWMGPPHASEAGYAHAKRGMLAQLEAYAEQYGVDYAMVLSTNLFGPADRFDEERGHVLPSLVSRFHRSVRLDQRMVVWGDGSAQRDFLYSKDAATGLRILLERGSGVYNLASGRETRIREVVDTLAGVSGYRGEIEWDTSKPNGQRERSYDVSRLTGLGWTPRYGLEEALRETYEWFDANASLVRR